MSREKQACSGTDGELVVSPFFNNESIIFVNEVAVPLKVPTQFLARRKQLADSDWSYIVLPGNENYWFSRKSKDMHLSTTQVPSSYVISLLNGSMSYIKFVPTQLALAAYVPFSSSSSGPLKAGTISPITVTYEDSKFSVPTINNGLPMVRDNTYEVTATTVVGAPGVQGVIILDVGTKLTYHHSKFPDSLYFTKDGETRTLYLIAGFDDDIKYDVGNTPNPFVNNQVI